MVEASPPQVAYRETITQRAEFNYTHKKQTGGSGQYGRVVRLHRAAARAASSSSSTTIDGRRHPARVHLRRSRRASSRCSPRGMLHRLPGGQRARRRQRRRLARGRLVRHRLPGGRPRRLARGATSAPSRRSSSRSCGSWSRARRSSRARSSASSCSGAAMIIGSQEDDGLARIEAEVPLAEMFGYSTILRSATQGKAEFTMEFSRYLPVPPAMAEELVKKAARRQGSAGREEVEEQRPCTARKSTRRARCASSRSRSTAGSGKGNLGVVMAPAGVGKTACLVHIGLDDLMRERDVLHVALGQTLEHVSACYDALFDELASGWTSPTARGCASRSPTGGSSRPRGTRAFGARGLEEALGCLPGPPGAQPGDHPDRRLRLGRGPRSRAAVGAFKAFADRTGAELWMTARDVRSRGPGRAPHRCPAAGRLRRAGRRGPPPRAPRQPGPAAPGQGPRNRSRASDVQLGWTRHPAAAGRRRGASSRSSGPPGRYTLLAGGCAGAEEEFGACAERWGVQEVNFTFGGRPQMSSDARAGRAERGRARRRRREPRLPEGAHAPHLPRVAAAARAPVHLAPGQHGGRGLLDRRPQPRRDGPRRHGLGGRAGAPLGQAGPRLRPGEEGLVPLDGRTWAAEAAPAISRERFAGTGTRFLGDEGRAAIRALFERTFGAPQA